MRCTIADATPLDNRFSVDYSPFVVWGHSDVQPGMPPADSNPVSVTFFS